MIRADFYGLAGRGTPRGRRRRRHQLEPLERRALLSLAFQFNYTYDSSGYFAAHPAAEAMMEEAGRTIGNAIDADLAAIDPDPGAGNTWDAVVPDPSDPSRRLTVPNMNVPADTVVVYVGTSSGAYAGLGGPGGWTARGASDWTSLVASRGQPGASAASPTAFGPWGGMVTFNVSATNGPDFGTALHELCHVLGIGTAGSWFADVDRSTNQFIGAHAEAVYAGPVPLDTSEPGNMDGHWALGTQSGGADALMTPNGGGGAMTPLDWAGLEDVGWRLTGLPEVAPVATVGFTATDGTPIDESTFGQAVTIVASINPIDTPSGTVVFSDGASIIGAAPVDADGVATLATSGLATGPHTITATFETERSGLVRTLSGSHALWVEPATPMLSVVDAGGVYDGGPFPAAVFLTTATGGASPGALLEGVAPSIVYYDAATGAAIAGVPTAPGNYNVVATFAGSADYRAAQARASFSVLPSKAVPLGPSAAVFFRPRGRACFVAITVRFLAGRGGAPLPSGVATFEFLGRRRGRRAVAPAASGRVLGNAPVVNGRATFRLPVARALRKRILVVYGGDGANSPMALMLPALVRRSFHQSLAVPARRGRRP